MKKIGINGFGRIGRLAFRIIASKYFDQIEVPIINTSGSIDTQGWAHLFEFDTMYRRFEGHVEVEGESLKVNGHKSLLTAQRDPSQIAWGEHGVETVIESTGMFRKQVDLQKHLRDSVRKVILSSPGKEGDIQTIVLGVNSRLGQDKTLVSSASCTTNCVAPISFVIDTEFGIQKAALTTIHAYTSDQRLQDGSHNDLRRARSAAQNIIPTSTGAATATTKVLPGLNHKLGGVAIRVPVATGSLTDFTFIVKKSTTVEVVNQALTDAAHSQRLKKYLWVSQKPLVSSDIIGCSASALVDLTLTQVIDSDLVKIFAWYDNEWGYANRLVEQVLN